MEFLQWETLTFHIGLAMALFLIVNWIGKHAVDFGYVSTSLFEEPNESLALNFFIRALSPAVFIILVSSGVVALDQPHMRIGIFMVVPYYFVIRASIIVFFNRQRLVSWVGFVFHAIFGCLFANLAYEHLILPNRSLLPDLETAGNELWLALMAFVYTIANKVTLAGNSGTRRRNAFVGIHYKEARRRFGAEIESKISDDILKLIAYSVLVYEDYCRPPAVRTLERMAIWKEMRTTGIMQVSANRALSDDESVTKGLELLLDSWEKHSAQKSRWKRVRECIADYNRDEDYVDRVSEVMEILAKRADRRFDFAYESIWSN